jgi:acyl-homoserine lactone acylase PvdQ
MTPDKYIPYLYNVSWDTNGTRGERMVQLLDADDSVTKEDAKAFMMDVYDIRAPFWQKALKAAVEAQGKDLVTEESLAVAIEELLAWDCQYVQASTTATLMEQWRIKCDRQVDTQAILDETPLSPEDQGKLLTLLAATLEDLEQNYGKSAIPYGEIHKVGRDGIYYPYDGADFGGGVNGTRTVRNVEGKKDEDGIYIAMNGSIVPMLMFFHKDHVESYTAFPWGQSSHKDSPHFMDQGRELYSKRELKPTWFKKDDLLEHVESEKVLSTP